MNFIKTNLTQALDTVLDIKNGQRTPVLLKNTIVLSKKGFLLHVCRFFNFLFALKLKVKCAYLTRSRIELETISYSLSRGGRSSIDLWTEEGEMVWGLLQQPDGQGIWWCGSVNPGSLHLPYKIWEEKRNPQFQPLGTIQGNVIFRSNTISNKSDTLTFHSEESKREAVFYCILRTSLIS